MSREKEKKYIVKSPKSQSVVDQVIKEALGLRSTDVVVSLDMDTYWAAPGVDFVRLRKNSDGTGDLTAKLTDRGTIEDRQEETIPTRNYPQALAYATLVHGEPLGEVTKTFTRNYFSRSAGDIEIATYRVLSDKRIFLEIEGDDTPLRDSVANILEQALDLEVCTSSIFDLFIKAVN